MKTDVCCSIVALLAIPLVAAGSGPVDEVKATAKKLAGESNYSWTATVAVPEGSQFRPGPTDGKTELNGLTHVIVRFGDNETEVALKGKKAAVTNRDGEWESASELENAEGFGRFLAVFARNVRTPAVEVAALADAAKDLQKNDDGYSGELTEDGAESFLRFRGGDGGPTVSDAKGSVTFWLTDGKLVKYEFRVQGTISFNGNDREVDRTTTVEIKDIGKTKVVVPAGAEKKLS